MRQTGFNDTAWGKETRAYTISARSLSAVRFDTIIQAAQKFMRPVRSRGNAATTTEPTVIDNNYNECASLVDDLSDDETCLCHLFY